MTTLLDALSDGSYDLKNVKDAGSAFAKKLPMLRDSVVSEYLKFNIDLNKAIADIVKRNNLNEEQTKRVIEEVNNQVYLIKYNQMKNVTDRDVIFDIASLPKVNEYISGVSNVIKKENKESEKVAANNCSFLEKVASINSDDNLKGDMFTNTAYELGGFSLLTPTNEKIAARKLASEIRESLSEYDNYMDKAASNIDNISEALVKIAQLGENVQEVFNNVCKQSGLLKSQQMLFKSAFEKKASRMEELGDTKLNYGTELDLCDSSNKYDEYSLGKYSLSKTAKDNTPSVSVSNNKKVVRGVNDLISMVLDTQGNIKSAGVAKNKLDNLVKKADDFGGIDELEKVAFNSFGAFGKALSGVNKKKAKEVLNVAKKGVDELNSNAKLQGIKKKIDNDKAILSKINTGGHERMESVKYNLNRAKDNLEEVSRKNDGIFNEASTQGPLKKMFNSNYKDAKREVKDAKRNLRDANTMYNSQKNRASSDVKNRINNNKHKYRNMEEALNANELRDNLDKATKDFDEAARATRNARATAALGVGVPATIYGNKKIKEKKDNAKGPYMY